MKIGELFEKHCPYPQGIRPNHTKDAVYGGVPLVKAWHEHVENDLTLRLMLLPINQTGKGHGSSTGPPSAGAGAGKSASEKIAAAGLKRERKRAREKALKAELAICKSGPPRDTGNKRGASDNPKGPSKGKKKAKAEGKEQTPLRLALRGGNPHTAKKRRDDDN